MISCSLSTEKEFLSPLRNSSLNCRAGIRHAAARSGGECAVREMADGGRSVHDGFNSGGYPHGELGGEADGTGDRGAGEGVSDAGKVKGRQADKCEAGRVVNESEGDL